MQHVSDAKYVVAALIQYVPAPLLYCRLLTRRVRVAKKRLKLEAPRITKLLRNARGIYSLPGFKSGDDYSGDADWFYCPDQRHLMPWFAAIWPEFPTNSRLRFYPLARLIGIPLSDALSAGSIMAAKLVAKDEFVAMIELQKLPPA